MPVVTPRTSPLHERHVAAGAKLADFGGWTMPIEYAGGGVLAEHTAVRTGVGRKRSGPLPIPTTTASAESFSSGRSVAVIVGGTARS